jgi:oligopeptide transport system ATP-binding protein
VENSSVNTKEEEFFPETNHLENAEVCLELRNIRKYYPVQEKSIIFSKNIGHVKAVDGVDLQLYKGETLGLVGESGCGKSTLARIMINLEEPTTGAGYYRELNIHDARNRKEELKFRRSVQLIFQDPYSSLNPRMLIRTILREPLKIHFPKMTKEEQDNKIIELLNTVGLESYHALRYPHEFSGGQRQRLGIARALIMEPEILLADEPVSALDVSVQASVLNLMQDLQEKFGLTMVFIAHDLSVIKHVSNRVAVMYLGRILEIASTEDIFNQPGHPYTVALLSAIPFADPDINKQRIILEGDVPSPINIPDGCRFAPRCYKVQDKCKEVEPVLELQRPGQYVACHFIEEKGVFEF